jgi:leucyl aminopeptidase
LHFFHQQKQAISVDINSFLKLLDTKDALACLNGFLSADICFNHPYTLKTKKPTRIEHNFIVDADKYASALKVAEVLNEAEIFATELMAMPSNYLDADRFEQILLNKFKTLKGKVNINVLHKADLQNKKMGLILAVGQASNKANEPRIITAEYHSAHTKAKKLALIGKGIMFDTGGLNLKPGDHMKEMHMDMSGAAITFATIYALAKLEIPANVVGVGAIASNDIGNDAFRVNDVITSYSGKTVEILNTDAEGRLILADAITFAHQDLKADTIMTIATLTGAIDVALGNVYSGI